VTEHWDPPQQRSFLEVSDLRVHFGLVIALLAAVWVWWLLTRSTLGFSLRAVGANAFAARTAGMGIERSYQAMADADLTLLILDLSAPLTAEDRELIEKLGDRQPLLAGNKCDLERQLTDVPDVLPVSALTGAGILELRQTVLRRLAPNGPVAPESGSLTSIRHAALLRESQEALQNSGRAVSFGLPHEMLLLDLYAALRPIDAVTGATTADDILNRIFSTFCIGK